jgi:hypothetical protein
MKFKCYLIYVELIKMKILSYCRTNNENRYCNEAYDDFDTIPSGVRSPPPVSCSLYRDSPMKNVESSKMDMSDIKKDQSMTPRECWTPESYS